MLNYAGKYGEYCNACQAAVTVIRSNDAALKSGMEWLAVSYVIGDSAYLIFSAVLQTEPKMYKPANVLPYNAA